MAAPLPAGDLRWLPFIDLRQTSRKPGRAGAHWLRRVRQSAKITRTTCSTFSESVSGTPISVTAPSLRSDQRSHQVTARAFPDVTSCQSNQCSCLIRWCAKLMFTPAQASDRSARPRESWGKCLRYAPPTRNKLLCGWNPPLRPRRDQPWFDRGRRPKSSIEPAAVSRELVTQQMYRTVVPSTWTHPIQPRASSNLGFFLDEN